MSPNTRYANLHTYLKVQVGFLLFDGDLSLLALLAGKPSSNTEWAGRQMIGLSFPLL